MCVSDRICLGSGGGKTGQRGGAMKQRRIYNPAQLSPDELKASFVARQETLTEMLRLLGEQNPDRPCQHMLLVGCEGWAKPLSACGFSRRYAKRPILQKHGNPWRFTRKAIR